MDKKGSQKSRLNQGISQDRFSRDRKYVLSGYHVYRRRKLEHLSLMLLIFPIWTTNSKIIEGRLIDSILILI